MFSNFYWDNFVSHTTGASIKELFVSDDEPIPATIAVEALNSAVEESDMAGMLGFPLVTKAEPYAERWIAQDPVITHSLTGALIFSAFIIVLIIIALAFLAHRAHR